MVELAEVTTVEEFDAVAGHEVGADGQQTIGGIPCRPIKILLTKSLTTAVADDRYADGANIDAWLDLRDGSVFVWENLRLDPYYLEAEEFQSLEDAAETEEVAVEKSPVTVTWEPSGWEAEALEQIKSARLHVALMEAKHLDAKERAKDAKADWEAAVNRLTEVIDDATKPMPLFDRLPINESLDEANQRVAGKVLSSDGLTIEAEAWRAAPIDDVFSGLTGFGPKKQEALRDVVPTLGAFEDLRKKASLTGEPLKNYMPKGIGQEACDQLEEASLNAISRIMTLGDDDAHDDDEADSDLDEIE